MATSLNGWTVLRAPGVERPGPHGLMQGFASTDVGDLLAAEMWLYHTTVDWVTQWGGWRSPSFNDSLGQSASKSNHLSATATDTDWDQHPFIRSRTGGQSFTAAERAQVREIDRLLGGLFRFGWVFGDDMHREIAPWTSGDQVKRNAAKLRKWLVPPRTLAEVRAWQRAVGVKADGKAGPSTIKATRAYQKKIGVPQTGLWDERTKRGGVKADTGRSAISFFEGAQGADVKELQSALITLSYDLGRYGADADFGPTTTKALRKFQVDRGLTVDGKAGPNTLAEVDEAIAEHKAEKSGRRGNTFFLGAVGPDVKRLQSDLEALGFLAPGGKDGVFGKDTDAAVKKFESSVGFKPNGTVTPALLAELGDAISVREAESDGRTETSIFLGARGADVKRLQGALDSAGYDIGPDGADGVFGPDTDLALRQFQKDRGLDIDGRAGPDTWAALTADDAPSGDDPPPEGVDAGGRIISRKEWGATAGVGWSSHPMPVKETWFHHSAGVYVLAGAGQAAEIAEMRSLERTGVQRFGYADATTGIPGAGISYTHVIFPSGRIYEGHDPTRNASHTKGHNAIATATCFPGNYDSHELTTAQKESAAWLQRHKVAEGINTSVVVTGGHRDTGFSTTCPGDNVMAAIDEINALAAEGDRTSPVNTDPIPDAVPELGQRLAGKDRFATAAVIATAAYPDGAPVVYLVADGSADAQTVASLNGPVLLVRRGATGLPADTTRVLEAIRPAQVVAIGGPNAVSKAQLNKARAAADRK